MDLAFVFSPLHREECFEIASGSSIYFRASLCFCLSHQEVADSNTFHYEVTFMGFFTLPMDSSLPTQNRCSEARIQSVHTVGCAPFKGNVSSFL